jgi:hypothetical protein
LHYCVQRQFPQSIEELIGNGADVNSVADHDVMPLLLAEQLEKSERSEIILDLLRKR